MSYKYVNKENTISPDEFPDKLKTIKRELYFLEPDSDYIRDDSGSVDSYTSIDEMQTFVEDILGNSRLTFLTISSANLIVAFLEENV